MSVSDIPRYNNANSKIKERIDSIISSLSNLDILDAIEVTRIVGSYFYKISQEKLKGHTVNS